MDSSQMHTLKLTLLYKGTAFLGWQKTPDGPSIAEEIEKALHILFKIPCPIEGASRTDKGVHALGQVAHFLLPIERLIPLERMQRSLNGILPPDIKIKEIALEKEGFHSTLHALKKEYLYQICNTPYQLPFYQELSWHVPQPLNISLIQEVIPLLLGTHDFSAFCNDLALWTRSTLCTLEKISLTPLEEGRIAFTVIGDHFLYKMVRNLVGLLVGVGLGKIASSQIPLLLQSKERAKGGVTAPALGLYLKTVSYIQ